MKTILIVTVLLLASCTTNTVNKKEIQKLKIQKDKN